MPSLTPETITRHSGKPGTIAAAEVRALRRDQYQNKKVMQKEFIKCYVAGKKAGIICDGSQFVLGHFFSAWNDGTQTSDRHGFLKFAGLQARTIDEARAEIIAKFGDLAEEGTSEYAAIREAVEARIRERKEGKPAPAEPAPAPVPEETPAPAPADPVQAPAPAPAPAKVEAPAAASPVDALGALAGLFAGIENNVTAKVMQQVNAAITDIIAKQAPRRVEHVISLPNGTENTVKDQILHPKFDTVLKKIAMGDAVYMYGPAGSGKNILAQQVAKALGLDFYYCSTITQEYKLEGFIDAGGVYHETEFYRAFKNGGLFMLDEMDASCPEALIILNNALEQGYFTFPCGVVKAHENFRCIAAGNTCGHGATIEFNGRMKIDEATLNRFSIEYMGYDERIELACAGDDSELVEFIHELRKASQKAGMYLVLGYRNIKRVAKYSAVFGIESALESDILRGMDRDDIRQLVGACSAGRNNKYMNALIAIAA